MKDSKNFSLKKIHFVEAGWPPNRSIMKQLILKIEEDKMFGNPCVLFINVLRGSLKSVMHPTEQPAYPSLTTKSEHSLAISTQGQSINPCSRS